MERPAKERNLAFANTSLRKWLFIESPLRRVKQTPRHNLLIKQGDGYQGLLAMTDTSKHQVWKRL